MSKLSFRARALDATKPLPIYHADELPDLSEYNTINRTVPQMPTGMEKEEEGERHLQEVILAQQTNSVKKKHVYIPTPDAAITVATYEQTTKPIHRASQYVRVPGLGLEEEVPDYDLDSEDDEWLSAQTNERPLSPTHFERMMDKLEKGSGNTVLSEKEAQLLLRDDEDLVLAVYDYWLAKRLRLGRSLIPTVRNISKDGTSSSGNPYLAFRKRMEKMQTRKNRKNDETAYMQMLKLKRDLEKALSLADMVKERENKKHSLAQNQMNIFKKRYILEDWSGSIMSSLRPVATRSATSRQTSTVSEEQWNSRTVLIKMDSSDEYDVHHVGRHEVLVSSGLKKKRKKRDHFPDTIAETPTVPATPEKDSSRELLAEKLEDDEPDGIFTFKRKPHVKYHHPRYPLGLWPWQVDTEPSTLASVSENEPQRLSWSRSKKYRFSRVTLPGHRCSILARRRVGRGGRVILDRVHLADDSELDQQDEIAGLRRQDTVPVSSLESQASVESVSQAQPHQDSDNKPPGTKEEVAADTVHRLHFQACSPSPSSKFEFQSLPFIELPDRTSPPLGGIGLGGGGGGRGTPGNYQPFSANELRLGRLPSLSDSREEALTFSTLPTSQFALRPSTSDMDLHLTEQQHSLFMQRTGFDMTPEPYSWSWVRNARLNPLHLGSFRRTSDHSHGSGGAVSNSGGHGGHAHPSSSAAPGNYHSIGGVPSGTVGGSGLLVGSLSNQQLPGPSSSSSTEPIDISRSSLSVTNSKTIILSNAPVSQNQSTHLPNSTASATTTANLTNATAFKPSTLVAPPTTTPTSTKGIVGAQPGTTTPQTQSQIPQQQQKLTAQKRAGTGTKKSSPQSTVVRQKQETAASLQQTQAVVQPSTTKSMKKEDKDKKEKVAESKKSVLETAAGQLEGVTPTATTNHASGESESLTGHPNFAQSATVSATPPASVATSKKEVEPSSKGVSDGATVEPMETSHSSSKSPESNSVPQNAEKPKSADSKGSSSTSLVQKSESVDLSKTLNAWMMSKPSASIQQLSRPRKREHDERNGEDLPKTKNRRMFFASADAALITSQFAQQAAVIKKEEPIISQPLTVTHALNSAMAGLGARNVLSTAAAGLPISSTEISTATAAAAAAAVSHTISKLPLSMATTPNLSVVQNSATKLQQQEAVVNSIQDGVAHLAASIGQDKKTVVNAVSASGQAQTLPGNLSVRRPSTGTNGTNSFQEIFHTERVKQALAAGINHNSFLESTKNALVPMNKSSEVT